MKKITFLFALLCASVMGFAVQYCELPTGHLGDANFGDASGRVLLTLQKDGNNVIVKLKNNTANGNPQTGLNYMWVNATGATNNNATYGSHSTANTEEISVTVEFSEDKDSYTFNNIHWAYEGFGGEWALDGLTVSASELCAAAACADNENPTISAVATSDITYNSAVLTVTASDNIGVTGYIVKNGASQIASSATSPITITGLTAATTYDNIKVIAKDACNNESAEFAVTSFTTGVRSFCSFATGHLGQANFGDANGRILLTLTKLSASSVGVTVEPNNGGADVFDFVEVILGGDSHTLGAVGGSAPTNTEIVFDGLASLDFSINVLWHNHNWADAGGRWTTQSFAVTEAELCPGPIASEYCKYEDSQTIKGGKNIALTWETDGSGNVIITMQPGTGTTSCSFRNGGFEGGINAFVVSDDNFATTTPASDYFTAVQVYSGNTYTLTKTADLPANAKIKHVGSGHALAWVLDGNNEYSFPDFIYTYGGTCNQLDAPTNVSIDANNIITFDAVTGASSYTAYVSLSGVQKYSQVVVSGDELTFTPLVDGDYDVTVVASGTGKTDSDPSAAYVWSLTAVSIDLGNSEYCEHPFGSGNQQAALTWETDGDGNIVITISDVIDGTNDPAHFRGTGMAIGNFEVGAGKSAASNFFNHACSGNQVTLSLKNPSVSPALGEKIYFTNHVVEYTTKQNTNAYGNYTFEYTYGTVCSGKAVSAISNNNTMGTAVVQKAGVDVTNVEVGDEVSFIATVADAELYRFVNWTKGGVEVSTSATYVTTITESTNLIANFDYIRNTYCHTEINSVQNKKLYLTLGSIGGGQYQIKIEGSEEAQLTALTNANYTINWVTTTIEDGDKKMSGQDVPFNNARWAFDASGYGSATAVFGISEGKTWEDIHVWNHAIYFSSPNGEIGYTGFPDRYHIDWDATCSDAEAPVFDKAEAEVLNETSVQLKIQATDNWGGLLTYTIAREAAEPIISNHASGEEFTQDVTGLTAGTEYTFTVTVSDGVNNANQNIVVTPVGDSEKPVMGEASLESKTWHSAIINVAATDNKGVAAYYVIEKDADYVATEGKITIEGLTAATAYTFNIKAKDAAGNISDNQAEVSFTTDAHSLVPTTAAPVPTWPAEQVKSIYSDTYELAPAHTPNYNAPWWSAPAITLAEIDGNHYMDYNLANDGMIGWQYDQISVATMEKLHIDIYASAAGTVSVRPITDGDGALNDNRKSLTLVAQQWNSFDIDLTEFGAHDWTKLFQFSIEYWAAGGLLGEHISVDNVYFYRTTELVDNEKPTNVSANVAKASFGSITLNVSGEDNQGSVLYSIKIGDTEYAQGAAASGASKAFTLSGLTQGTDYSITVIASDESGNEADPVIVAAQTNAITAAPVPTHNAAFVRSVYCDAYETALAHDFLKNTWTGIPYSELDLGGDHVLAYTNPNMPNQMPDVAWGENSDGGNAIIAKDGFNDGTNKGLDVRNMQYIHFDIWSSVATTYPELRLNDTPAGSIVLDGSGWQSFDLDITSLTDAQKSNIRWIKFIAFRDPAPEDIVIDNVYFYSLPEDINFTDTEENNSATIAAKNNVFANVTINRTFPNTTEWYTLCLPFDLSDEQLTDVFGAGYTLAELVSSEDRGSLIHLNFDYSPEFQAGKAYLITPGEGVTTAPTFNGVVIKNVDPSVAPQKSEAEHMHFQGTFNYITLDQANQRFVGPENYLYTPDPNGTHMKAFRCYFTIPANAQNNVMGKRARIVFGPQTATDIENVSEQAAPAKFMMDGVLYIIRDGKTYNAQGMLVK